MLVANFLACVLTLVLLSYYVGGKNLNNITQCDIALILYLYRKCMSSFYLTLASTLGVRIVNVPIWLRPTFPHWTSHQILFFGNNYGLVCIDLYIKSLKCTKRYIFQLLVESNETQRPHIRYILENIMSNGM